MTRGFTKAEILHLTGGGANAVLVGSVQWRGGGRRGDVEVDAAGFPRGSVRFVLNLQTPNSPSIVLIVRGSHAWRLDVNVAHRELPGTHMQETDELGRELQALDARGLFPPIPEQGNVDGHQYRALFLAFAAHLNVDGGGLDWSDPPERSTP